MAMLLWFIRLRQTIAVPKLGDLPMKRLTQGMHGLTGLAMAAIQGLKGCRALDTGLVLAIEGVDRAQLLQWTLRNPERKTTEEAIKASKMARGTINMANPHASCMTEPSGSVTTCNP
jgi:hypothetical protein